MALTTPTELATTLGVGTLYSDATLQEICDAADAVLLPMLWSPTWYTVAHSNVVGYGTLYFNDPVYGTFYVGQSVTIANSGSSYNGTKTITSLGTYSFTVATNHNNIQQRHPIAPYGTVSTTSYTTWTDDTAVQLAALMISVDIFQSKQAPASGGVSIDGYSPSPYRMGNTLLARVRGLISHALSPNSQIG